MAEERREQPYFFLQEELKSENTRRALALVAAVPGEQAYHPLGTGVFVVPHLILTAKHVVDEAYREFAPHFRRAFDSVPPFQIKAWNWPASDNKEAIWGVTGLWSTPYSDLALLSAKPDNGEAEQNDPPKIAEINVAPPEVGDLVMAVGYPKTAAIATDTNGGLNLSVSPSSTVGEVITVHESYRDRGLLDFPCFEVRAHVFGGMSGGPIFNMKGQLCGIVCASMEGHPSFYGLILYPILGMQITHDFNNKPLKRPLIFRDFGPELIKNLDITKRVYVEDDMNTGKKRLRLSKIFRP
jgi:S1-C subfamily serine protease